MRRDPQRLLPRQAHVGQASACHALCAQSGFGLPISRRRTFAFALQASAHSDLPAPAGAPPLGHPACAGQIRRRAGHGEPKASSTKARGVSREDAPVAKHDAHSLRLTPRASKRGGEGLPLLPLPLGEGRGEGAFVAPRKAPSPGLRPASPGGRGEIMDGRSERPARRYGVTPSRRVRQETRQAEARPTAACRSGGTRGGFRRSRSGGGGRSSSWVSGASRSSGRSSRGGGPWRRAP